MQFSEGRREAIERKGFLDYFDLTSILLTPGHFFFVQHRREQDHQRSLEAEAERSRYYSERTGTSTAGGYYTGSGSRYSEYSHVERTDVRSRFEQDHHRDYDSQAPISSLTNPESGELYRPSVYDEASRPDYQMAPVEGGVWKAMTALANHPTEGWMSLWKGNRVRIYPAMHVPIW